MLPFKSRAGLALILTAMIVMTMFPAVASADAAAGSKVFFEEGGEEATYEDWNN